MPELSGETEKEHFNAEFFGQIDVILTAGGSWEFRR